MLLNIASEHNMTGCRKSTQAWCVTLLGDFSFRALEGVPERTTNLHLQRFQTLFFKALITFSDIKVALRNATVVWLYSNMVWV